MDEMTQRRIAELAELGTQSPLHAVRATEQIRRLTEAAQLSPSPATAIDPNIYPAAPVGPMAPAPSPWQRATIGIQQDVDPTRYQATGTRLQTRERIPVSAYPAGVAPSQCPPVIDARNHPPSFAQTIQPAMAPNLWLTVPGIPPLAPGQESPGEKLSFDLGDGILLGMRGTALYAAVEQEETWACRADKCIDALIGLKISINGQEQLIVDGQSESWAWFSDLFVPNIQWTPLFRHVLTSDSLTARFLNRAPVGGPTIQPSLMFGYRRLPMPI